MRIPAFDKMFKTEELKKMIVQIIGTIIFIKTQIHVHLKYNTFGLDTC